jgi:hypothetical protein
LLENRAIINDFAALSFTNPRGLVRPRRGRSRGRAYTFPLIVQFESKAKGLNVQAFCLCLMTESLEMVEHAYVVVPLGDDASGTTT